jgi:hypothetical protein
MLKFNVKAHNYDMGVWKREYLGKDTSDKQG